MILQFHLSAITHTHKINNGVLLTIKNTNMIIIATFILYIRYFFFMIIAMNVPYTSCYNNINIYKKQNEGK